MIDRDKVICVLHKRFQAASPQQVAWAANAIVGLDDEWEEVEWDNAELACPRFEGRPVSDGDLADGVRQGTEFRMFARRWPDVRQ